MFETGGYQLGDLAIAAHHSSGTDSDGGDDENDDVVVDAIGGNDGNDEEFEHKVHVPTRMQLAKQRFRSKLFRGSRKPLQNGGTSCSDVSSGAIRRYLTVSC